MPVLPEDAAPPLPPDPYDPTLAAARPTPTPAPAPAPPARDRSDQRLLVYSANQSGGSPAPLAAAGSGGAGTALAARLQPTPLAGVSANLLRNQPYLLTTGNVIPCVLQTAIDPQDVLGKTGVTLLDRGTRVVGEFQGGVRQGQARLFVLWTRAETPQGVVVSLASPASDPLGRSGLPGAVDTHFWQRFGGALLLTTIDGAIQAGVAAASEEGTTTINTGRAESVIAETLRGTINLPPTIRKAQGELVSIMVARDLDFSSVYGVTATAGLAGGGNP
jgi:type IV secretion system protein VirB10